jgi:hypothetical protein
MLAHRPTRVPGTLTPSGFLAPSRGLVFGAALHGAARHPASPGRSPALPRRSPETMKRPGLTPHRLEACATQLFHHSSSADEAHGSPTPVYEGGLAESGVPSFQGGGVRGGGYFRGRFGILVIGSLGFVSDFAPHATTNQGEMAPTLARRLARVPGTLTPSGFLAPSGRMV